MLHYFEVNMKNFQVKLYVLVGLMVAFFSYSLLLYFQDYPESIPANKLSIEGKNIWQEKNCASCHQLYGLGGHLGPDLTNVSSKRHKEYIKSFLKTGTKVMPNFNLSDSEIKALLAFFEYIDKTGSSDPKSFELNVDGTITQINQNKEK